jgi:hypothetical protein
MGFVPIVVPPPCVHYVARIAELARFAVALVLVFRLGVGMSALVGFIVVAGVVLGLLGWL